MSLQVAILGAGSIARKFAQAVRLTQDTELCAVASKSEARAQTLAQEMDIPRAYGDYERMLNDSPAELVYVATTNNFHYDNVMLCLNSGKHVLCEKPLAMTAQEVRLLAQTAQERGLFLMEGMWSCFLPAVLKAREWVAQGRVGTVSLATYTGGINAPATHRIFNRKLGGGALYDLGCYPIEIVNFVLDELPEEVRADLRFGAESQVDESGCLLLKYAVADAAIQFTAHARIPSPSGFYGDRGYIRLEQTHRAGICELYDGEFRLEERFEHPVENGFEYELAHVRDCILQGRQQSELHPLSHTLRCAEIFDQALEGSPWKI